MSQSNDFDPAMHDPQRVDTDTSKPAGRLDSGTDSSKPAGRLERPEGESESDGGLDDEEPTT